MRVKRIILGCLLSVLLAQSPVYAMSRGKVFAAIGGVGAAALLYFAPSICEKFESDKLIQAKEAHLYRSMGKREYVLRAHDQRSRFLCVMCFYPWFGLVVNRDVCEYRPADWDDFNAVDGRICARWGCTDPERLRLFVDRRAPTEINLATRSLKRLIEYYEASARHQT